MSVASPPPLLPPRRILILALVFLAAAILAYGGARWAQSLCPVPLGIGRWFPVAYGHPRGATVFQWVVAALAVIGFATGVRFLPRLPERHRYGAAVILGFLAILATTATHGAERGFAHPVAGRELHAPPAQYWHDAAAQQITTGADALRFVRDYETIQPTLREHGRTHPPGAVLFFALLRQVSGNRPVVAAVLVCLLGVALSAAGFRQAGAPPSAVLLFCALPAVQIYFCATLDAVIAGLLFLGVVSVAAGSTPPPSPLPIFDRRGGARGDSRQTSRLRYLTPPLLSKMGRGLGGGVLPAATLTAASFLTFGVVWVVPVLLAAEIARTRRFPWRTASALLAVALFYAVLYVLTGFDYVAAFRFASGSENPDGFRLLANPVEYVATRIENVADWLFFAGPFALWAAWRGLSVARRKAFPAWVAFIAGVASLLLLFLAGAYRTGETARACLFLYPLLVLVTAHAPLSERDRETLAVATFCVAAVLQCAGFYFW